jgi:transcriptional regulator with XRE-family HTH domain
MTLPNETTTFASQVFEARMNHKPRRLSQRGLHRLVVNEFGAASAITLSTIQNAESGNTEPTATTKFQLRKVLGI